MSVVNSPVQDLIIRIKNWYMARRKEIKEVIFSNLKRDIVDLLKRYGFIRDYEVREEGNKKFLKVHLHEVKDADTDIPVVKFYSKPSLRWYVWSSQIKKVAWGKGIGIISTNRWVMASHEARAKNLWWELIAEIY